MDFATITHLADLSKLNFADEELSAVAAQMSDIVALMDNVKEADVAYDIEGDHEGLYTSMLRADEAKPSMETERLLQNAEHTDECFVVPKVVE